MISRRKPFDLDIALDDLAQEVAASVPEPGGQLQTRVLDGAAQVLIDRFGSVPKVTYSGPVPGEAANSGGFDLWAMAAVAAAAACLAIGLGLGYEWGDEIMVKTGFEDTRVAAVDQDDDGLVLSGEFL